MLDRPDYLLIAELSTPLALNTIDPNAPIPLNPESDGYIVSIEASAWDPAMTNASALGAGVQATPQQWGSTEKFLAAELKIDSRSLTQAKYLPLIHLGGTATSPKPFLFKVTRAQIIYVSFKNLLTSGPALAGRLVFNMISGEARR